jgi:hypothetical protein
MTPNEVSAVLAKLSGTMLLMARVMFGSGLRVEECCTLRIKDIDFDSANITVRDGKGGKDRTTVLPGSLKSDLQAHLMRVAQLHADDKSRGAGLAPLPGALEKKYPKASESLACRNLCYASLIATCLDRQRICTVSHVNAALQQPHWRSHEALLKQQVPSNRVPSCHDHAHPQNRHAPSARGCVHTGRIPGSVA